MSTLTLHEMPSEKASTLEIAQYLKDADGPRTMDDALDHLRVYDPARQRSLQAAFMKECGVGKKYAELVGTKLFPSTKSRGKTSAAFGKLVPIAPRAALMKRSDAFAGLRSIDRSSYPEELVRHLDNVTALNMTGKAAVAVNRLALEYDHARELDHVRLDAALKLAEERGQNADRLLEVLDRITGPGGSGSGGAGSLRLRPTQEAAE